MKHQKRSAAAGDECLFGPMLPIPSVIAMNSVIFQRVGSDIIDYADSYTFLNNKLVVMDFGF